MTSAGLSVLSQQASAKPAPVRPKARSADRRGGRGRWFVLPFLAALTLFMFVPLGYAIYTSLFTTKLIGGTSFSGLANYGQVLSSPEFWDGVRRVVIGG